MAAVDMLDAALDEPMLDLGPARAVAIGLIVAALGWDVWLLRNGYGTLTDLARTPSGEAFIDYFGRHCKKRLAVDLFSIGGRVATRIPQRRAI